MGESDIKVSVVGDSSDIDQTFAKVERGADKMAQSVTKSGERASKGMDGVGKGADGAAKGVERSTKSMVASIQRQTAVLEAGSRTNAKYWETLASQRGVDGNALKPYLDQLESVRVKQATANASLGAGAIAFDRYGISAKQTAAAMRGVPAQMTDIIVSLQGGQRPMTVLLQQGGQLKDMFGGIVPAARALGSGIMAMVNPFTLATAAIGGLYAVYRMGASEGEAFQKTLLLTGNAAGVTAGQLQVMSQRVGGIVSTQSAAAAALNEFARSARFGVASLEDFSTAAIRWEQATGTAVSETVKQFEELGKDPLKASLKLNESMNYLTESTYDQIKALVGQGREMEAAKVAQDAFAEAINQRSPEILQNLNLWQRAWNLMKQDIQEVSSMLGGIGRSKPVEVQLVDLDGEIAQLEKKVSAGRGFGMSSDKRALEEARARRAELLKEADALKVAAEAERQRHEERKKTIALGDYLGDPSRMSRAKQMEEDVAKEKAEYAARVADAKGNTDTLQKLETAHQVAMANIKEKYKEKKGPKSEEQKELERQQKAELKAIADFEKERQKSIEGQYSEIAAIGEKASKIEDEIAVYGMSRQAIQAMEIARLREQATVLSGFSGTEEQIELIKREIAERERLGKAIAGKERLDAEKKANEETRREWEKTVDQYGDVFRRGFADMLNNGKDGWKSFTKSLVTTFKTSVADQIYKMFAQPFVVKLVASMTGLIGGGAAAAAGLVEGGGGGGGGMGVGDIVSNLSSLNSAYGALSQAITGATAGASTASLAYANLVGMMGGDSIGALIAANGGWAGAGAGGAAAGSGATAGGGGAGGGMSMMWPLAVVAGMVANYNLFKQGWDPGNGSMPGYAYANPVTGLSLWTDKALRGLGISDKWAATLSGSALISRAFGRKNKEFGDTTIDGQFSGTGFRGRTETPWSQKGGWFRSDASGMQYGNLDRGFEESLGASFLMIKAGVSDLVESIGISADSLIGYTQSIRLTMTGDAAGNDALITNMLKGVGESMIRSVIPTIGQYVKDSESAMDALQRLSVSLSMANGYMKVLGNTLFDVSVAGADAASKLADAFGGMDKMTEITQAFYEVAYTEGERATASMEAMRVALQSIGVSMPRTMRELREMALALDLTTDAGREAYAALLAVAPQFAAVTDALANAAQALGDKLMASFSARSPLMAAMDAMQLKTLLLGDTLVSTYESMGSISTLFLDLDSGLITFGGAVSALDGEMTGAQEASAILADQMGALQAAAKGAVIDFAAFDAQLSNIDTDGFIATISKAFQSLAQRIDGVIGEIGAERIAVRQAAQEILDPSAMTPEMIRRQIAGINTTLPSGSGVLESGARLAIADAESEAKRKAAELAKKEYEPAQANYDGARNAISALVAQVANAQAYYDQAYGGATRHYKYSEGRAAGRMWAAQLPGLGADLNASKAALAAAQAASTAAKLEEVNRLQEVYNAALAESTAATAAAALDAKQAQIQFADALQEFAIDAGKSVAKLSNLREETLKYYQAQKQLAELMGASAFGLRKTVADYRYSQMDPDEQFNRMQGEYAKNYAMALSTDGEMLAGYADKMNAALAPMLEAARNSFGSQAQYDGFVATALARAEAIAGRLDALAPDTYDAESLALLGQIDLTLAALEESARSAEQLIVAAVNASRDATVDGLRQIANALNGGEVAAFAAGGFHAGGLRIVGENGPELEATGPSRIFTASQTSAMLSGGGSNEMAVELRALRQEVANLRIEARATATTSAKTARSLEKLERGGIGVYAQDDEALPIIAETV